MKLYYGLINQAELTRYIVKAVEVFGGGDNAVRMLAGTCCVESHYGKYADDNPEKLGVSVVQFDSIRLQCLRMRTRPKHRRLLKKHYGVDLRTVKLKHIAYNQELAVALCRMAYLLIPESFPTSLMGQARYWKRYWNTYADNAKGTIEHYIECWHSHKPPECIYL